MKYIILKVETELVSREIPIIFPNMLVHSDVAKAIIVVPGMETSQVVSAGFLNSLDIKSLCHGESETLKIKSRNQDTSVIQTMDYFHGLCED